MTPKKELSTILYVDDEPSNLKAFEATFRRYYNVLTANTAHEGIELLKKNKVELIITDQRMPEMTGVQFLEAIIPIFPDITRMILTGFSDVEAIIKAINNGSVLRYIMKPWDVNELKQIIDTGIKIHSLEQSNAILYEKLKAEIDKQKQVIELFQKYVPLQVIEKMTDTTDQNQIIDEGEARIVSILFADIRDFTSLSEKVDPKVLVSYLNQYLTTMINCIVKNQGTVYKLLGDGIVAIFGAPVSSIHNQHNAVMCAIEMIEALKEFNKTHGHEVKHEAKIGIGISTGETMVGHIVTEHFLSYIAISQAVDQAFEVENLTHELPNSILITEATYQQVKSDVEAELYRTIEINGVKENIYRVIKKVLGS